MGLVSTYNQKFKTTKLMKSHLGNIDCHSAMERKGVTYTSKNRREITGRKKKKKCQKPSGKRKRVRLSKKRYADFVLTSVEGGNMLDQSLRSVASDIFEGEGVVIKTSQLRKYMRQRDALNKSLMLIDAGLIVELVGDPTLFYSLIFQRLRHPF